MAGVEVGTAYVTVVPSAKGFASKLQGELGGGMSAAGAKAGDAASKGFGKRFSGGMKVAAVAGAAALAGAAAAAIGFGRDAIAEARESQKVGAMTENVIRATGKAAKVTATQVGDLATAISNKTGIDDETIQSGANMLLTFKNIRNEAGKGNDVFNQSTQVLTDMATAMGTEPKQAAIQLGKALNDPVKGISALSRVGVTFTEQQKKTIKSLVEGGKTAEAQKIILKELNSEFGGSAAASATAGEKLATAWGNFKEGIGTSMLPLIDKVAGFLQGKLLPGAQQVIDVLFKGDFKGGGPFSEDSKIIDILFRVRDGLAAVIGVGKQAFGILFKGDFTGGPLSEDSPAVDVLFRIRDGVVSLVKGWRDGTGPAGTFRAILSNVWEIAKNLWHDLTSLVGSLFKSGDGMDRGASKAAAFGEAISKALDVVASITGWLSKNSAVVSTVVAAVVSGIAAFKIITMVVKAYTAVQAALNVVLSANPIGLVIIAIAALVAGVIIAYKKSETFRNVVKGAFEAISKAARFMWNNVVAPVIRFLLAAFSNVTRFYAVMLRGLSHVPGFGWAKKAADALDGAANKADKLRQNIRDIPSQKTVNVDVYQRYRTSGSIVVNGQRTNAGQFGDDTHRANGGTVRAGQTYVVGERRPELFVPSENGRIEPRVSGGGGLSQADINRLAAAMSQVQLRTTVSAGSFDSAMAVGL